jgi:hypothetical protein
MFVACHPPLIAAHSKNNERYQRLLKTRLRDFERQYVEGRLLEECAAMQATDQSQPRVELE